MRIAALLAVLLVTGVARAQTPSGSDGPQPAPEKAPPPRKGSGITVQYGSMTATLYGLLDVTASSVTNADANHNRVTNYQTGWFSGSRWGVQGRDAVDGDNLGVIFKLESEYAIPTGAEDTSGVLFNRDAWVGVDGTIGKLTFGRQNTLARDFSQNYGDAYGTAAVTYDEGGWTNTNNFKQLIFYAGSITSTRYDRGVVWKKGFGPIMVGAGFQFGDSTQRFATNTTKSLGIGYNGGIFNVSGFYTWADRLPSATAANSLAMTSASVGGNVTPIPQLRINAGYFHYTSEQGLGNPDRKDDAYTASVKVAPVKVFDVEVGWVMLKVNSAGVGTAGNVPNPLSANPGAASFVDGDKNTYYASVFYHLDARAEVYLAGDYMKLNKGYHLAATNGASDQTEIAAGLRFKF